MRLRVLAEAERELRKAMLYYEDCREGLGQEFHERIAQTLEAIGRTPLRFPLYEAKESVRELRRALVNRFPHFVVFEVRSDEVLIVAVAHTSRAPAYWEDRS